MNKLAWPSLLVLPLALAGCQSSAPSPSPSPSPTTSSTTTAVRAPSPSSPDTRRRPISEACKAERDIVCPPGYVDGCSDGRTILPACVALAATPGPTCEAEIKLVCKNPDEVDGCGEKPPASDHHICVYHKAR